MPVYEYKCKDCGEAFEVIQKVNDPPKTACDKCNGELYKVISSSGLVFKGSGWYVTDYSNKLKEPKKMVEILIPSQKKQRQQKQLLQRPKL